MRHFTILAIVLLVVSIFNEILLIIRLGRWFNSLDEEMINEYIDFSENAMNFAYSFESDDADSFDELKISILHIIKNLRIRKVKFHIMTSDESVSTVKNELEHFEKTHNLSISIHKVTLDTKKNWKNLTKTKIENSNGRYFPFMAHTILPKNISNIIHLQSDCIVTENLQKKLYLFLIPKNNEFFSKAENTACALGVHLENIRLHENIYYKKISHIYKNTNSYPKRIKVCSIFPYKQFLDLFKIHDKSKKYINNFFLSDGMFQALRPNSETLILMADTRKTSKVLYLNVTYTINRYYAAHQGYRFILYNVTNDCTGIFCGTASKLLAIEEAMKCQSFNLDSDAFFRDFSISISDFVLEYGANASNSTSNLIVPTECENQSTRFSSAIQIWKNKLVSFELVQQWISIAQKNESYSIHPFEQQALTDWWEKPNSEIKYHLTPIKYGISTWNYGICTPFIQAQWISHISGGYRFIRLALMEEAFIAANLSESLIFTASLKVN